MHIGAAETARYHSFGKASAAGGATPVYVSRRRENTKKKIAVRLKIAVPIGDKNRTRSKEWVKKDENALPCSHPDTKYYVSLSFRSLLLTPWREVRRSCLKIGRKTAKN